MEPIAIAANDEIIGIKREPPKKPRKAGNSIFRYLLCKVATVIPIAKAPKTPVSMLAPLSAKELKIH